MFRSLLCIILTLLVHPAPTIQQNCDGCDCGEPTVMKCSDLDSLPIPPPGILKAIFKDCAFPSLTTDQLSHYSGLTELTIENSAVTSIENDALKQLAILKKLDLSGNPLNLSNCTLPSSLEMLDLSSCGLTSVPAKALTGLDNLQKLNLSGNSLGFLSCDSFEVLDKAPLRFLFLDSANVTGTTEHPFRGLNELEEVQMSDNRLTSLHKEVFVDSRPTLVKLGLDGNQFVTLSKDLVHWEKMNNVTLGNNPWLCDCNVEWMNKIPAGHLNDYNSVVCAGPEKFVSWTLYNVTGLLGQTGNCHSVNTFGIVVAAFVIIVGVILISYFVYKIVQKRRQKKDLRKKVKYSEVYKDTVEGGPV